MLPLIGISCELQPPDSRRSFSRKKHILVLNRDYAQAIEGAGGVPIPVSIFDDKRNLPDLIGSLDGLILSGGSDVVAPGQDWRGGRTCLERSEHEAALLQAASDANLPVLGICRGLQQINVFKGGTLWDDLPASKPGAVDHRRGKRNGAFRHPVNISPVSRLATMIGNDKAEVNSYHHQAAREIGKGLCAVAYAEDGVIEALESTDNSLLWAVQWHPERLGDHPAGWSLLKAFIAVCTERKTLRF